MSSTVDKEKQKEEAEKQKRKEKKERQKHTEEENLKKIELQQSEKIRLNYVFKRDDDARWFFCGVAPDSAGERHCPFAREPQRSPGK